MQAQLRVVAVGHVDHGKSTLIGRLLHDTGNLSDGKVEEIRTVCARRNVAFEWSFVLDAMQSERDQAVTIDTTRIWMRTPGRDVVLIDAPGHKEFLRNMVTGASDADAALLLVDAYHGVSEQTRRHALLLELIGIRRVVVAINKMDRVGFERVAYDSICLELGTLLGRIGIAATAFVPTCASDGDNVVASGSQRMPWYGGPTVLGALLALPATQNAERSALRLAVQGVVRRGLRRVIVGRIASGRLRVCDEILVAPSGRRARVASLERWPSSQTRSAGRGESIGFTLDAPLFVDRGDVISSVADAPARALSFRARILWLGTRPLVRGDAFRLLIGTRAVNVRVATFTRVVDIEMLETGSAQSAQTNDVAEVAFESTEYLALDTVAEHPSLGRFILLDGLDIVAGGTVLEALPVVKSRNVVPVGHAIDSGARSRRNGHRGAVVWLTGLPAAGKSTIALRLERQLFERGYQAYVLDGDNVRTGLCSDLMFTPEDRHENVRRVGEVAALFADAGTIAIVALVSPYRSDRARARAMAGEGFHEVYVCADAALCEGRDPKGHYEKARAGDLPQFTGIIDDYEVPLEPDLMLDTRSSTPDEAVAMLFAYVERRIVRPSHDETFARVAAQRS